MAYYDALLGKLVDERPKWWDTRRQLLGRGEYAIKGDKMSVARAATAKTQPMGVPIVHMESKPAVPEAVPEPVIDPGEMVIMAKDRPERPSYGYSAGPYDAPWKTIDSKKWPAVFWFLVKFYYGGEYHKDTKWISDWKPGQHYPGYRPYHTSQDKTDKEDNQYGYWKHGQYIGEG